MQILLLGIIIGLLLAGIMFLGGFFVFTLNKNAISKFIATTNKYTKEKAKIITVPTNKEQQLNEKINQNKQDGFFTIDDDYETVI